MRSILLPVMLVMCGISHGQGLIHFDDTTGVWQVADTYPHADLQHPNFVETSTTMYYHFGDSVILGEAWSMMYSISTNDIGAVEQFEGLTRQEGDIVLFLDALGVIDTLYDFNLHVGDFMHYISSFYDTYLPVIGLDSILIQGTHHRVIHFGSYMLSLEEILSDTWIQGIGSIHGPLAPRIPSSLGFNSAFPDSTRLTCYQREDTMRWSHPGYSDCIANIILSVADPSSPSMTVFPNPARGQLNLELGTQDQVDLVLTDALGSEILHRTVQGPKAFFELSGFGPGAYQLRAISATGRITVTRLFLQ